MKETINTVKENGSDFYNDIRELMLSELKQLENFTAALDLDPVEKKARIWEYKCAKYREAGIMTIRKEMYFCNKGKSKCAATHYLLPRCEELIINDSEFLTAYNKANDSDKFDVALFFAMKTYALKLIAEKEALLEYSTDWERIELSTYIEGHRFALDCLNEAWERRNHDTH